MLKDIVGPKGMFTDGDWILSEHLKTGNEVRLIQLADVGIAHFQDKSHKFISRETAEMLSVTYLQEGDVLISRMADPLARACLFPRIEKPAITAVDVAIARCDGSVSLPAFMMYLCNSHQVMMQAEEVAVGTTRKRISRNNLEQIRLGLPPLAEQRRIVAKLEELLGKVDTCRKRLAKIPVLLKRFRQSVLAVACSGRLTADWRENNDTQSSHVAPIGTTETDLPRGWRWSCAAEMKSPERYSLAIGPFGSNLKVSDYVPQGVPLVFVREIRARSFGGPGTKSILQEKARELAAHSISGGDLLITKMGGPPGDVAIYPLGAPEAIITADCIKLRVNELIADPRFVGYVIESPGCRERMQQITSGVAQQKISLERFRQFPLQLAPLPEQHEIVRRVEALFALADQIEARYAKAKAHVDRLTQSILAKAFRGELVPQDPNDEPASALLERIREERSRTLPRAQRGGSAVNDGRGRNPRSATRRSRA